MKVAIFIFVITVIASAQSLRVIEPATLFKGGDKTYFNPMVEKTTQFGFYQIREKESQKLYLFHLKNKDFNPEIVLKKRKLNTFGVSDENEVFLAPFLVSFATGDEAGFSLDPIPLSAILSCTLIDANGKYKIRNYTMDDASNNVNRLLTTNPYSMINYPFLGLAPQTDNFVSLASSDKGILYSWAATAFDKMDLLTHPQNGVQDVGPVLSPNLKYLAFTRIYTSKNQSTIIYGKIKIKNDKLFFKKIKEIGFGKGTHCQSPSFSPNSQKLAYYTNKDSNKELYSIYIHNLAKNSLNLDKRVAEKALRKTLVNRGPTWLGNNIILFVKHVQKERYPIYYSTLNGSETRLGLETVNNKDISVWQEDGMYHIIFTSIGKMSDIHMIYNKIYTAILQYN